MTTLAYRSGVLATDSRMTKSDGTLVTDSYDKIENCEDKSYTINGERVLAFALAGVAKARDVLSYALSAGIDITTAIDSDDYFSSIIVTKERAYYLCKEEDKQQLDMLTIPDGMPFSSGSGGKIAHHFLITTNCDPADAVAQAIKSDVFSGGDIVRWSRP